jgi:DNA-directed RNA polymerase subunit N (RpoN/RPB10)
LVPRIGPVSSRSTGRGESTNDPFFLAGWQQPMIDANPGHFLRGLFHSDGCRVTNRIRRGDKTYAYPRYNFSNESADIMGLCEESLDRLGIDWRMCRRNMLSVARREAVAELDRHVGPKW